MVGVPFKFTNYALQPLLSGGGGKFLKYANKYFILCKHDLRKFIWIFSKRKFKGGDF